MTKEKLENRAVEEKEQIDISKFKPVDDKFRGYFLKLSKEERFKKVGKIKKHLELLVKVKYPTTYDDADFIYKVIEFWEYFYKEYSDGKTLNVIYVSPAIKDIRPYDVFIKEKMKGVEV